MVNHTSTPLTQITFIQIKGTRFQRTQVMQNYFRSRYTGKARETMLKREEKEKEIAEKFFKNKEYICKNDIQYLNGEFKILEIKINSINSVNYDNYKLLTTIYDLHKLIIQDTSLVTYKPLKVEHTIYYRKMDLLQSEFKKYSARLEELKEQLYQKLSSHRVLTRRMSL